MVISLKQCFIFLFFLSLFSCKDYKEVRVTGMSNFKLKNLTSEGMEAEVSVTIDNPNSLGFNIYKSKAHVTYGALDLGTARISKKVHVPPNSKKEYVFVLKGSFKT